jgi:hypothetical protein
MVLIPDRTRNFVRVPCEIDTRNVHLTYLVKDTVEWLSALFNNLQDCIGVLDVSMIE